jgi:hypothetical protein
MTNVMFYSRTSLPGMIRETESIHGLIFTNLNKKSQFLQFYKFHDFNSEKD